MRNTTPRYATTFEQAERGRHRLLARLARGGMGDVYLARARGGADELVVLKELRGALRSDPASRLRFFDEARLAALFDHTNVVRTAGVGFDADHDWIVMEFLQGQPLDRIIRKDSIARNASFALQLHALLGVLEGLHHVHEQRDRDGTPLGVVHRDVSPSNVFVAYDGAVKLVDFGIARAVGAPPLPRGVVEGKIRYMAPEQAQGHDVDRRADVFAAGVMLWEAIAGRRMWASSDDVPLLACLVSGRLPSLRDTCPAAPDELVGLCERALAHDRRQRFATAKEMGDALGAWLTARDGVLSRADAARLVSAEFAAERAELAEVVARSAPAPADGYDTPLRAADDDRPMWRSCHARDVSSGAHGARATARG